MSFFNTNENIYKGKTVLLLGSGGLRIGQAGEFDYSGSQAIKALKEEEIRIILVNPNIATVQTAPESVDELYLQPLNFETVSKIIEKEKPDGIMLSFGGQTALNLGLELYEKGVLERHQVTVLGSLPESIRATEDREIFKSELEKIGLKSPISVCCKTAECAITAAEEIGYPIMMRSGFTLGGLGSGKVKNKNELQKKITEALTVAPHVLIEEYLLGWKEYEYEIVRDHEDNVLTICNMENMDPMGVHTGESIVVAPSQTLNNEEYHRLRERAIRAARHFSILGECNIQFAVNPNNGDYRVIEMNARLSRSSALASKATGYPLAFVAAKLALRRALHEIKNNVTQKTCAFFEPALDYIVVKIPRWDTHKLRTVDRYIGTEMKSVGEVMAIGRTFPEALQKAVQMLNIGATCICDYPYAIENPEHEIEYPTDRRLFALAAYFKKGGTIKAAHALSKIQPWFLQHIKRITLLDTEIKTSPLNKELLRQAKQFGFSDKLIAQYNNTSEMVIRQQRLAWDIKPVIKQIDTLAGEFNAETNYLYLTYHGSENDIVSSNGFSVIILGSGPYCIGSSVEFDWCSVLTSRTLRANDVQSIIINSNPETVSTDYDESDRLYFEQLSLERIQDIADFEKPQGIILSVGGQIANNLALPLYRAGYPILGTSPNQIDTAENRKNFSLLLSKLEIDQPDWIEVTCLKDVKNFVKKVGYPVLIRPSYVLSGAAMNVIYAQEQLDDYLREASITSPDYPVVVSSFIEEAKELEIDGVAKNGEIIIEAISEHIENAGVHSGDATIVLPPQRLCCEIMRRIKEITSQVVKALNIHGPFNIQFLEKNNELKIIECNIRASRSFPFVSKITNHNFIEIATQVFLNKKVNFYPNILEFGYVGVKNPQFSYHRLKGSDPVAHVEMASTGEVAVIGDCLLDAYYYSWQATEQAIQGKRILLIINSDDNKNNLLDIVKMLSNNGYEFFATEDTHQFLILHGIDSICLYKNSNNSDYDVTHYITKKKVDLVINVPSNFYRKNTNNDDFTTRRLAIDYNIPLITNFQLAILMLRAIAQLHGRVRQLKSWREFVSIGVEIDPGLPPTL